MPASAVSSGSSCSSASIATTTGGSNRTNASETPASSHEPPGWRSTEQQPPRLGGSIRAQLPVHVLLPVGPSSHSSRPSMMPSPQYGSWHHVRHALGSSAFLAPSSHASCAVTTPSPQTPATLATTQTSSSAQPPSWTSSSDVTSQLMLWMCPG